MMSSRLDVLQHPLVEHAKGENAKADGGLSDSKDHHRLFLHKRLLLQYDNTVEL